MSARMSARLTPTPRLIALAALGVPLAVLLGVFAPGLWAGGIVWAVGVGLLFGLDALLAARPTQLDIRADTPSVIHIGRSDDVTIDIESPRRLHRAEASLTAASEVRVSPDPAPLFSGTSTGETPASGAYLFGTRFRLRARRRGEAEVPRVWLRWTGPLGLAAFQRIEEIDRAVGVVPDTLMVRDTAAKLFMRDASLGQKIEQRRGEGTEFDALVEFTTGMDRRHIDWKHSARHRKLHAKEFRTERNHNIVFAFDTGHLMCEPVLSPPPDGEDAPARLTKLDLGVNAALLMAFVSLKLGDKVGLFAFDAKPYLFTKPVAGSSAFAHMQALTGRVEYSETETNFVLGLSELSRRLNRRSLIVVFTDFVDTVSAELMVENISRLVRRHLVVFVTFRDAEIDAMIDHRPQHPTDLTRAVVADTLARERSTVLARLERLGVQILETDPGEINMALLNRFLDIKRRELL